METEDRFLDDIQRYQYKMDNYERNYRDHSNYEVSAYDYCPENVVSKYDIEQTNLRTDDYLKNYNKNRRSLAAQKAERMKRIRGLLFRIILACSIFILLFFAKLCSFELFEYNTERVIEQVENNSWIESLEQKIKGWFS